MSEKEKQNSLFFKQRYVTDWGIYLFRWIKEVGKFPLLKTYSFLDIISSKTIKKNYLLIITGGFLFGLFLLMIFAVWKIPQIQVPNKLSTAERERITLEDKVRTTLIQAIGGSALFITGCFAFLNYQISQKKLESDKKTAEDNLKLADSKQITERFSKAVEQLGNEESITVRLGGIYSLERIAKDSKDDHWTIMEVLTAFIRENSNRKKEDGQRSVEILSNSQELNFKIPQDIQSAISVIMQRNTENDILNKTIDLSGANLNGVEFFEVKLDQFKLYHTKLNKAIFYSVIFNNVNLNCSELNQAFFFSSKLIKVWLSNAQLVQSIFVEADLTQADLTKSNLAQANLTKANLTEADLTEADFTEARIIQAKLVKSTLIKAILVGADFTGADLSDADIEDADFTDSYIYQTQITVEQILKAKNWDKAHYSPDFETKLQLYLFSEFMKTAIF
jgi:uncharacterized protein YjbI with pentapeptide repeats